MALKIDKCLFPRRADKLDSVRTHKGQCIHFYVHVNPGNPTRTPVCALLGWVRSSYTGWYISKRASRDTVRGGKPQRNVASHPCIMCMYIRHVCRQRIEFILPILPTASPLPPPLYPSVASRRSSIQIASPLGILNLWYARCALLILCHAYASWILQRSPEDQRDTACSSTMPSFSSPGLNSPPFPP